MESLVSDVDRIVIEVSKDSKKWEEICSFSDIIISPSEAISIKKWKYIRIRLIKEE